MNTPNPPAFVYVTRAALVVLVTLIITLLSLWLIPGEFGARLYLLARVAVVVAGGWAAWQDMKRNWR